MRDDRRAARFLHRHQGREGHHLASGVTDLEPADVALPHPELLLGGLGAFVLLFGVSYVMRSGRGFPLPRWTAAPIGIFGGATSAVFGIGGPIHVFFLAGRGAGPTEIRATMPVIFMFTTVARIVLFIAAGLYSPAALVAAAALLPVMALGVWTGHHLHLNLSRETVIRVMGGLLVISGVSLIVRALG